MISILCLGALVAAVRSVTLKRDLQADKAARHTGCSGNCRSVNDALKAEADRNFKTRPSRGKWEAQLKKIVKDASDAPCNATIMATSYARYFGFGSRMNSFSDEMLIAMYLGVPFSLCDSKRDHFIEAIWAPHFENVAKIPRCKHLESACMHGDTWDTLHIGAHLRQQLSKVDHEYIDDLKHFLYRQIYKLSQATEKRVDQRLQAAGLVPGEPYVAVHVRHGDKFTETPLIGTDEYSNSVRSYLSSWTSKKSAELHRHIRRELQAANASMVFVSSDDANATRDIRKALGKKVRVMEQNRSAEEGYGDRGYEHEEVLMSVLTDVEALRRASAFIGTASSNIGRLVYFLRPRDSASVSLDMDGNWLIGG